MKFYPKLMGLHGLSRFSTLCSLFSATWINYFDFYTEKLRMPICILLSSIIVKIGVFDTKKSTGDENKLK